MYEQKEKRQRADEYVQLKYKTESPNEEQVQAAIELNELLANAFDEGMPWEEAEEKAWSQMEDDLVSRSTLGVSNLIKKSIKELCLEKSAEGNSSITAEDVFKYLKENYNYSAKSSKGIGDVLGHGHVGLCLEASSEKVDGKKAYRIPNPDSFVDWYSNEVPVPQEYYTPEGWIQALRKEGKKTKSAFLRHFSNQ